MNAIISLDLEANGLHGQIFALAATLHVDGRETERVTGRCPICGDLEPWVADNVLPALEDMSIDTTTVAGLAARWAFAYQEWRTAHPDVLVIAHVPWPIEARFLWDAHRDEPFSGPFPLIDVASMIHQADPFADPTDVETFLRDRGIPLPAGTPHHPLYDCRAAARAYFALTVARDVTE